MNLTGVPADRIVETRDPYRALEIVQNFDPRSTRLILAVSQKDMEDNPRFTFGQKKDGSPTYLQPLPQDPSSMLPLENHGYIMVVPTFGFKVLGQPAKSATEIRRDFASADEKTQAAMIKDLFGAYRQDIHSLMKEKIKLNNLGEDAAGVGVIASKKQMNDPRYKMSLTKDVRPGTLKKMMKALRLV